MNHFYPNSEEFKKLSKKYNLIPVYKEISADLETPVSAYLKTSDGSYSFLLESVEGGENLGRWSIVATKPLWEAVCYGEEIVKTWNDGKTETFKGKRYIQKTSYSTLAKLEDDLNSIKDGEFDYESLEEKEFN